MTEVRVTATGRTPVQVMKLVRRATGLPLRDVKDLVDHPPFRLTVAEANVTLMTAALQAAGATVQLPPTPTPDTIHQARDDYAAGRIELHDFEQRIEHILTGGT